MILPMENTEKMIFPGVGKYGIPIQGFISAVDYLRGEHLERPASGKDLIGQILTKAEQNRILLDQIMNQDKP